MNRFVRPSWFRQVAVAIVGQAVLAVVGAGGCQTTRGYTPTTLPVEWQAVEVRNPNDYLIGLPAPQSPVEVVEPGDLVEITIDSGVAASPGTASAARSEPVTRRVREDGKVFVPEVGIVHVAGTRLPETEQRIVEAAEERGVFPQAVVTVSMKRKAVCRVRVYGAVKVEGEQELPRTSSVLVAALRAAGGLTEEASPNIEVYPVGAAWAGPETGSGVQQTGWNGAGPSPRGGPLRLNLAERIDPAIAMRTLEDGSVVIVDREPVPPYQVLGQVQKSDAFAFPVGRKVHLSEAISKAGGTTQPMVDEVTVTRRLRDGTHVKVRASLRKMQSDPREDLLLQPGDTVNVEHNALTLMLDTLKRVPFGIGATVPLVP